MNLISISIRRPVFAWILMSALIIFGAISFNRLGTSQMPDIDFPVISVSVSYDGAAPEVIEAEIIEPIEQKLLQIEGIKEMRSSIRQGSGSVTLDLDISRNVDVALQEVQAALSQQRLPLGVDPPVIRKTNPEDQPIMFVSVSSDKPFREMLVWTDQFLLDQFRFIPGMGEVSIGGFSERNMRVYPDPKKLRALDFTVADIVNTISNQHQESAAGQMVEGDRELRARWMGEAGTADELANLRLLSREGGGVIRQGQFRIKDIATVEDGLSDIRRMARRSGKEAIGVGIRKQRGGNEVVLAESVRAKVEELKSQIPEGYEIHINADFTKPTAAVVATTNEKLLTAAVVTIIICFLFLGSWQSALNILFSIPTSIVGTLTILYFSDFTLNIFTLLALTLAISIVVDDAIMLLENIVRHYRMKKTPAQAAYDGSMEILPAASAATMAVVAVFLPVVFMDGVIGKFFFQFGVTMSAAVLLSLLEAVTITPMRAAAFLSASPKTTKFEHYLEDLFHKIGQYYGKILAGVLKYSKTVVVVSLIAFAASMWLVKGVRQEFVPSQDQNFIILNAQLPPGSSLSYTHEKALVVEQVLNKHKLIEGFFMSIGAGGPASQVNQFFLPITLVPREERTQTHNQIMDELRGEFRKVPELKDVRISMRDISSRGLTSGRLFPVSFNISGPDLNVLAEKSNEISKQLEAEGLVQEMDTDFKTGLPELLIKPNRDAMAARGVSVASVSSTLSATLAGLRLPNNRFTSDGRRYDIRIKLMDDKIRSVKDLQGIYVRNNYGNSIPLSELVTFHEDKTFQAITRVNRQRSVGVFGSLTPGKSQSAVLERARVIAQEKLPTGYSFRLEGAAAGLSESFKSLAMALVMGIVVAYMILAIQFNSFIHPVSILMALPFSMTGALLTLWMTDTSMNLFSFIGLIVLMGIAKKNSILLVEFANHVRMEKPKEVRFTKKSIIESLVEACPVRLRPILMTSAATIAAAAPLAMGNTIGQETRTPMGLTIIGGTVVSTVLTLFVVPCIYVVLSRLESKKEIELDT